MRLHSWSSIFLGVALFVLPLNVFLILWQDPIFYSAHFNPYTTFSFYVSEVFIALAFLIVLFSVNRREGHFKLDPSLTKWVAIFCGSFFFLNLIFGHPFSSLLHGIHLIFLGLFFLMLRSEVLPLKFAQIIFLSSVAFQAFISVFQFVFQRSLGLSFLGESFLNADLPGISRISLLGMEWIRGYGTLPHPNILAGYLLCALILVLFDSKIPKIFRNPWLLSIFVISFVITFSQGAWLAFFVVLALTQTIRPWVSGLIFLLVFIFAARYGGVFFNSESVQERLFYSTISLDMLRDFPFGVGFHQFTSYMHEFTDIKIQPWQFQPVHNVYLLSANELGIFSTFLIFVGAGFLIRKFYRNSSFVAMAIGLGVVGLFDHYWFSLYPGMALGIVSMSLLRFR